MNSILRAFAVHWPLLVVSTLACMLGGAWVIMTSAPRYEGSARVVLDYIQPDPTTGEVVPSKMLDAYLTSQLRMLRDPQVAASAAEVMGWMDNPDILAAYAARPTSDTREFPAWVASLLIPRIGARMVEGSNIMEISYFGETEELSRQAADALRTAYVDSDISLRQTMAAENATRLQVRLTQARAQLAEVLALQAKLSQETGVALGPLGRDQTSLELAKALEQDVRPILTSPSPEPSLAARELAQLRASLSGAERSMGPNHPTIQQLRSRIQLLETRFASEATAGDIERQLIDSSNASSAAYIEGLKTRVLAQREPALKLRLLQDQIEVRKAEVDTLARAVIATRAVQSISSTAISPIGEPVAKPRPVFPNHLLIIGGTAGLGFALGGMLACIAEIAARRVRNPRHIESATGAVLLAVLPPLDSSSAGQRPLVGWRKRPPKHHAPSTTASTA